MVVVHCPAMFVMRTVGASCSRAWYYQATGNRQQAIGNREDIGKKYFCKYEMHLIFP
ncbi:MAG: hypothetical protein F6K24_51295 [Okeania sp. SIO2D1]|uniref:hypothetical protein n=1 Tax=Okeania sp. SIO2C9 TaxID=2607791 RepID=UPI0013BCCF28|nr:hypothetical protein [Okeania sp. SIO2C9]NEQ75533.1 hypothetical protein [Okeania sp. SIO2C9]NES73002.1 hypothetical protein [Okeania sp. SIO2D1]